MTFEDDFPSLKGKVCIADGIMSCATFEIRNARDLEYAQEVLSEEFLHKKHVEKHCLDKAKVKEAIDKAGFDYYESTKTSKVLGVEQVISIIKKELGL